jgi:hypothetical protein
MKCPISYTFGLRIPFHLLQYWCHTSTNLHQAARSSTHVNTWLDLPWMIWSTSYHHVTLLIHRLQPYLLFTVALIHQCQVLAQASPPRVVHCSKASYLPFTLATGPSKPSLVLIFYTNHMTQCHVSYAISSFNDLGELCSTSKPSPTPWVKLLTLLYHGLITFVS